MAREALAQVVIYPTLQGSKGNSNGLVAQIAKGTELRRNFRKDRAGLTALLTGPDIQAILTVVAADVSTTYRARVRKRTGRNTQTRTTIRVDNGRAKAYIVATAPYSAPREFGTRRKQGGNKAERALRGSLSARNHGSDE